jgi:hypothetical protein
MKKNLHLCLVMGLLAVSGCATPEYKAAYSECSPGAFAQYPEDKVHSFEMRQRLIQVPTGQVSCTSVQDAANKKQTVCTPLTTVSSIMVMEPVIMDRNEEPRRRLINACTQSLCVARFGNGDCKPPVTTLAPLAPPPPSASEPINTTPP